MAPASYEVIDHSTFVDFTGYRATNATTAQAAYGFDDGVPFSFEDRLGGGDCDFNDLVIGVDLASTAGHGWTV